MGERVQGFGNIISLIKRQGYQVISAHANGDRVSRAPDQRQEGHVRDLGVGRVDGRDQPIGCQRRSPWEKRVRSTASTGADRRGLSVTQGADYNRSNLPFSRPQVNGVPSKSGKSVPHLDAGVRGRDARYFPGAPSPDLFGLVRFMKTAESVRRAVPGIMGE